MCNTVYNVVCSTCGLCRYPIGLHRCYFFKQKTAYELRISDWSSDVCSSDLLTNDIAHTYLLQLLLLGLNLLLSRPQLAPQIGDLEIGRASCRERVCQYV